MAYGQHPVNHRRTSVVSPVQRKNLGPVDRLFTCIGQPVYMYVKATGLINLENKTPGVRHVRPEGPPGSRTPQAF